jgi:hypothetical protein
VASFLHGFLVLVPYICRGKLWFWVLTGQIQKRQRGYLTALNKDVSISPGYIICNMMLALVPAGCIWWLLSFGVLKIECGAVKIILPL